MPELKEVPTTNNHGVRYGDIHLCTALLEVNDTLSLTQVLRKLILKSRAVDPQRICFIVVLGNQTTEQSDQGLQSQSLSQLSAVARSEIIGLLSVADLLSAMVTASSTRVNIDTVAISTIVKLSPLTVQWIHEEKSPLDYDILNMYAMDGHLIGSVSRDAVSWRSTDDHARLLFDNWEASDLCKSLSQICAKSSRPHRFMHVFQKCFVFIRGDETIQSAIELMKVRCIPAVLVLAPFANDVLGIARPIDLIQGLFTKTVSLQDPVSSCLDPALNSSRARRFCWSIDRWIDENKLWFCPTSRVAYAQTFDLSLWTISKEIHAVAMTAEVAAQHRPWTLAESFGTLTLYHRLYEIASLLPEIPCRDLNQMQLKIDFQQSYPSDRDIHDFKAWYQHAPDRDADTEAYADVKLQNQDVSELDLISIDTSEDSFSSTPDTSRSLSDVILYKKLLLWAKYAIAKHPIRTSMHWSALLLVSLGIMQVTRPQLLSQVVVAHSVSVQLVKGALATLLSQVSTSFSRIGKPIDGHRFGSHRSMASHLWSKSSIASNPPRIQLTRDALAMTIRTPRPMVKSLRPDTQSRSTVVIKTILCLFARAMLALKPSVIINIDTNMSNFWKSLTPEHVLSALHIQNRFSLSHFPANDSECQNTVMSASMSSLLIDLVGRAVSVTKTYMGTDPLLIMSFAMFTAKVLASRRKSITDNSRVSKIPCALPQQVVELDASSCTISPLPTLQPRIIRDMFSSWVKPAAPRWNFKPHPLQARVPPAFTFRIRTKSTQQYVDYVNIALSCQGFRSLMHRIQDDFFLGQHNLVDFADQISWGLDNVHSTNSDDRKPANRLNISRANLVAVPIYAGIGGVDAVLTPWDMVYAAQLAAFLGELVVDLHFREADMDVLLSSKSTDHGERLVCNRPFSHRSIPAEINEKADQLAPEQIIYDQHLYLHPLIPSRRNIVIAVGLGISSGLIACSCL